jgi:hypothetical protein
MLESSVRSLQGRPSSRGLRRWIAALACCVASAAPSAASAIDGTVPDRGESREAVLVGSSSFNQAFGVII